MKRPDWDSYFIKIAHDVATRSTCNRANVGAVLTINKRIIATGYNGAGSDMQHCMDIGHQIINGHCVRTVHAEQNAIAQAARNGVSTENAVLYCTHSPCHACSKLLVASGIRSVIFDVLYYDPPAIKLLLDADVQIKLYNSPDSLHEKAFDTIVRDLAKNGA